MPHARHEGLADGEDGLASPGVGLGTRSGQVVHGLARVGGLALALAMLPHRAVVTGQGVEVGEGIALTIGPLESRIAGAPREEEGENQGHVVSASQSFNLLAHSSSELWPQHEIEAAHWNSFAVSARRFVSASHPFFGAVTGVLYAASFASTAFISALKTSIRIALMSRSYR